MNYKTILLQLETSLQNYADGKYAAFGEQLGDALAETFIGDLEAVQADSRKKIAAEIVKGILFGAIQAEGLDHIEDCEQDVEPILSGFEDAILEFKDQTAASYLNGIIKIAQTAQLVEPALKECKNVKADWAKL